MRFCPRIEDRTCRFSATLLAGVLAFQSASCGTILHPERRGFHSGRLDPAIVALDAVGLLLFFVPGVIAFAVDFSTGAIYLPPDGMSGFSPEVVSVRNMTRIEVEPASLSQMQVETIVRERTGKALDLNSPAVKIVRLENIDEAPPTVRKLTANGTGAAADGVRRLTPW